MTLGTCREGYADPLAPGHLYPEATTTSQRYTVRPSERRRNKKKLSISHYTCTEEEIFRRATCDFLVAIAVALIVGTGLATGVSTFGAFVGVAMHLDGAHRTVHGCDSTILR
ncbi:hypothetical protein DOTSEDRAFT_72182 [Dothistroma septosporum NZE10]|uniref:Uncharacterized protein n=1 Tax=Dothistroma septosporum (strain NZE10 / CBS 128990) TaxID=675120 RepID=N1PQE1_DOTSN|nr:hypothetical protein DOTSEDRAFT_72182 [Dothistroma septosporum NZE10]